MVRTTTDKLHNSVTI